MTDWIANPLTNRYIKKGGNTYKTLVRSGIIEEEGTGVHPDKEEELFYTDDEEETTEEVEEEVEEEFYTDESDKEDNVIIDDDEEEEDGFYTDESDEEDKNTLPSDLDVDNMSEAQLDKLYKLLINIKK